MRILKMKQKLKREKSDAGVGRQVQLQFNNLRRRAIVAVSYRCRQLHIFPHNVHSNKRFCSKVKD